MIKLTDVQKLENLTNTLIEAMKEPYFEEDFKDALKWNTNKTNIYDFMDWSIDQCYTTKHKLISYLLGITELYTIEEHCDEIRKLYNIINRVL